MRRSLAPVLVVVIAAVSATSAGGQRASGSPAGRPTYCNPIDLDYKYNFEQINQGISYRSSADPVVVVHRGEYYLFATIANGYWHSTDLVRWRWVAPSRWPFEDVVAPAAISVRDTILLMQSAFAPRPILYTAAPATGRLEFYNRLLPPLPFAVREGHEREGVRVHPDSIQPGPWDPTLFHDDGSGRWYLYWGSSNVYPLYGIELDPARRLAYKGRPAPLLRLDPARHGWERFGRDHRDTTIAPYVEGAWMTKHGGRYYLQYGAPGTEYNVYATGTWVGDSPLGPFTYAPYNPVSYKPGGFVTGAGHGNTFQDVAGNWWSTGTPWVGYNWTFERRIAMFPAGFDRDGQLFASTRFGDFPHYVTASGGAGGAGGRRWTRPEELFTGWMLLSYRKPMTASSARDSFPAANAADENPRTFWLAASAAPTEWLAVDLGGERTVRAVQVNYADYRSGIFASDSTVYTQFRLSVSLDGRRWERVADLTREPRRDRPNAYVELARPTRARWVRYEHVHVAAPNLAVADLRVFGTAAGPAPETPARLAVRRDADPRNAFITWEPTRGAVGYNVLWGIAPDKLYQTYQRFADEGTTLELRALTVGQEYYVAVEAFDERGVSRPSRPVHLAR